MDRGAWKVTVHGVTESQTGLSDYNHYYCCYCYYYPISITRLPCIIFFFFFTSLVAQMVKSLLAMQETRVQSLVWEDPLEKQMSTQPSILAWRIPRTEESGGWKSMGLQRARHNCANFTSLMRTLISRSVIKLYLQLIKINRKKKEKTVSLAEGKI